MFGLAGLAWLWVGGPSKGRAQPASGWLAPLGAQRSVGNRKTQSQDPSFGSGLFHYRSCFTTCFTTAVVSLPQLVSLLFKTLPESSLPEKSKVKGSFISFN